MVRMNSKGKSLFENKIYVNVTKWLFPAILLVFSFVGVNRGIDCSDTGYNLGNYTYLSGLDGMWYYSTLFSNFVGWLIVRLPGGSYMLGANIYMGLIKASFGLFSYYYFTEKRGFGRETVFLANLISFGLWWLPNAGLYHYLSFYLFAVGAVLIVDGLFEENDKKLVIAGVVLAINVFVRFPNLTNVALIVVVWGYSILKKEAFTKCLAKTGKCVAGYLATLLIIFGIIGVSGKMGNYVQAIRDLFAMTGDAKKYSSAFMLVNLVNSYTCVWYWMIPVVLGAAVLVGMAFLPEKFRPFGYIASVVGYSVVYLWECSKSLFDYEFTSYSSIYLFAVVILVIVIALLLGGLFYNGFEPEVRMWCLAALVIQFVTPIGSNNSLYAVINNLFFILPVALYVLTKFKDFSVTKYLHSGIWVFMLLFMIQAVLFGTNYTFRDAFQGKVDSRVENNRKLAGMRTEKVNADMLTKVTDLWELYELEDYKLITFGNLPGLAYVLDAEPAISSTWPVLDSYSANKFSEQIKKLEEDMAENGVKVAVAVDSYYDIEGEKQDILKDFLQKYKFIEIYDKDNYHIWIQED